MLNKLPQLFLKEDQKGTSNQYNDRAVSCISLMN